MERHLPLPGTPTVVIHLLGPLRRYCGGVPQVTVAASTVHGALRALEANHPALYVNLCDETGAVRKHLNVFVNADNIRDLHGVDSPLEQGDVVAILPAVSGG